MRTKIATFLLFALFATENAGAAVPIAPACGVERTFEDSSSCLNASSRFQVCEHVGPDADGATVIELRDGGRVVNTWQIEVPGAFRAPSRVFLGDFTGDGVDDIAVITLVASSNGRVINTYLVCAADGANLEHQTECVQVQDYGKVGYFTQQPGARGCLLLQAKWRYGSELGRGGGTYLVGRWLRFGTNGFTADQTRPLVARRLLYGFEAMLSRLPDGVHFAWFRDNHTRIVTCPDPLCEEKR